MEVQKSLQSEQEGSDEAHDTHLQPRISRAKRLFQPPQSGVPTAGSVCESCTCATVRSRHD